MMMNLAKGELYRQIRGCLMTLMKKMMNKPFSG